VWISDDGASLSGVALTINIGWGDDITSTVCTHYDSGHDYYYNASKLSNNDMDKMMRNHWSCTTTSGWAAIKFPEYRTIGSFKIKSVIASTTSLSYSNIKFNNTSMVHSSKTILNGAVINVSDTNNSSYYQTTYTGDSEWISIDLRISKSIWKVCLTALSGYNSRLPKNFRIEASSDNLNWSIIYSDTTSLTNVDQFFTFTSVSLPYRYWRLYMIDNWGDSLLQLNKFELYNVDDAYTTPADGSPKDFTFYGSNLNPSLYFDDVINN